MSRLTKPSTRKLVAAAVIGSLSLGSLAPLGGCESLPGGGKEQGAVIGGAGGAAAGAAVSKDNRLLGALIGGVLGAGGGYLIGAKIDKDRDDGDDDRLREEAIEANRRAERDPAGVEDVARARTADLNTDGFVTLDEVVAMEQADLSDREMIDRLERTQQVFELTEMQENFLRTRGVSDEVIVAMRGMNQDYFDDARTASDRYDGDRYDSTRDSTRDDDRRYDDRDFDRDSRYDDDRRYDDRRDNDYDRL